MIGRLSTLIIVSLLGLSAAPGLAETALVGAASGENLVVRNGAIGLPIWTTADPGPWEKRAALDLQKYIGLMTGGQPALSNGTAIPAQAVVLGQAALAAEPALRDELAAVAKKNPVVQADAVVVRRIGSRLYVAGSNDESIYFAASWLLQQWGCRWYMPTDFGEVVPHYVALAVGALDHAYAPPFEVRQYWLSWNADTIGEDDFRHRNFMSAAMIPDGEVLDRYTNDIAPKGASSFEVPFSDPKTAEHVAAKIAPDFAAGKNIQLSIADGTYFSPADLPYIYEFDRHMLEPSLTDAMLAFYNNVAAILRRQYPLSKSKIGVLAYSNATLPPHKVTEIAPAIVVWLAPIDFDPNHAMSDPRSASSQEYGRIFDAWAKLMKDHFGIYDYDQGMLVWRDLPDPSQYVFARNVKAYRDAGILGISTESRGAMATTFLNLFFRGQLMWNPDADVDRLLAEFYPGFYGPAGPAMARYWGRIFAAWQATGITEHEYMAAPAIYTPALVKALEPDLAEAERAVASVGGNDRDGALYRERMRFTRLSFDIIRNYVEMATAAARDVDYAAASRAGTRALAARMELATTNPTFTARVIGPAAEKPETGAAWFPGEIAQMDQLQTLIDGRAGKLIKKLPLDWSFRVLQPLPGGWSPAVLINASPPITSTTPGPWRDVRSDLYLQAQGIHADDGRAELGYYAYRIEVPLTSSEVADPVRIMFPGLFNQAWLYVNGQLVGRRKFDEPWWYSNYQFEWDVDLTGKLVTGKNTLELYGFNPHHFAGMFRRPFLYRPVGEQAVASKQGAQGKDE